MKSDSLGTKEWRAPKDMKKKPVGARRFCTGI